MVAIDWNLRFLVGFDGGMTAFGMMYARTGYVGVGVGVGDAELQV